MSAAPTDPTKLFRGPDLRHYLESRLAAAWEEINHATRDGIDAALAHQHAEMAHVNPLSLYRENLTRSRIYETQGDAGVVEVHVAYEGDRELWIHSPNFTAPPQPEGVAGGEVITFRVEQPLDAMTAETVNAAIAMQLERLTPWIDATNRQVAQHNHRIFGQIEMWIARRRQRLEQLARLETELEIPIDEDYRPCARQPQF